MAKANFYLLFQQIKIEQANTISSPLTYGFPAVSGFVGSIHQLSRKMQADYPQAYLGGVMIACRHYELQAHRPHAFADYRFTQSRNPLKKNGEAASIIEEGKIHLEVDLVVEVFADEDFCDDLKKAPQAVKFAENLATRLKQQRIAGGFVTQISGEQCVFPNNFSEILKKISPAFILIDATRELEAIVQTLQTGIQYIVDENDHIDTLKDDAGMPIPSGLAPNPNATALDALLEAVCSHYIPPHEAAQMQEWQIYNVRQHRGWLVPIPIGYQGIYPEFAAGELLNARHTDYPSQYVETLYSLGKWVFPTYFPNENLEKFERGFWRYQAPNQHLYLYQQGA